VPSPLFPRLGHSARRRKPPQYSGTTKRIDVLRIDDWAVALQSERERRDFWEICEDRYQARSTILTSRLLVSPICGGSYPRAVAFDYQPARRLCSRPIHAEQDDDGDETRLRVEATTAGRNNEALEQVVMHPSNRIPG
jgi:hypothetical protein